MEEMDNKKKLKAFERIIDNFATLTKNSCLLEIVGSYAMYLHGMCEFEDVHDLDFVFHCSPDEFVLLDKYFYPFTLSSQDPSYASSIEGVNRYPINLHGLDICVFVTSSSEHVRYCGVINNGKPEKMFDYVQEPSKLRYKHHPKVYVKSVKDIIEAKLAYNREKDIKQIKQYAKNIIDMIPVKETPNTICSLPNGDEIIVTFKFK